MIYKFAKPADAEEVDQRFLLIEDRDDRVLVWSITHSFGFAIPPTFVYRKSDLVQVNQRVLT